MDCFCLRKNVANWNDVSVIMLLENLFTKNEQCRKQWLSELNLRNHFVLLGLGRSFMAMRNMDLMATLLSKTTHLTAAVDDFPEEWNNNDINERDDSYNEDSESPGLKLILIKHLQWDIFWDMYSKWNTTELNNLLSNWLPYLNIISTTQATKNVREDPRQARSPMHSSGGSKISERGRQLPRGCDNLLFFKFLAENCMKMKEFGPRQRRPPPGSATA